MAKGVESFDFPYPISATYGELLLRCFPGFSYERVRSGFSTWRSPSGTNGNVAIIAFDGAVVSERGFIADQSDLERLELRHGGIAEIGRISASAEAVTTQLATFLGAPYVVTALRLGSAALPYNGEDVSFIVLNAPQEQNVDLEQLRCAQRVAPELEVRTSRQFQRSSARYWTLKTGAGAAILLAALLAALLDLTVLSHGINRFVVRHAEGLLTLRAHGASQGFLSLSVLLVAIFLATVASLVATLMLPLTVIGTGPVLPWVNFKLSDLLFLLGLNLTGVLTGFLLAQRETRAIDIERIFRS